MNRRTTLDLSLSGKTIKDFRAKLKEWGNRNYAKFPWRGKNSNFHSLIAEILLQRTRAEQVEPVYKAFRVNYRNPKSLSDSSEKEIREIIYPLGLHWRARSLLLLGKSLVDSYHSRIPSSCHELRTLPGVGPYVASAYLSLHHGIWAAIIDSNVVRLYSRYFGFIADPETRKKKWLVELSEKLTPALDFRTYNYALLDFTREICKPTPRCSICPLSQKCNYDLYRRNI